MSEKNEKKTGDVFFWVQEHNNFDIFFPDPMEMTSFTYDRYNI